jgi:UDP-N-acetylmuramoylalanine--D-glutamate ligase
MSRSDDWNNRRVTVAGLGRFGGGIAVARWLCAQGARVLVTDKEPAEKLADSVAQLAGLPIEFVLGEHRTRDFTDADLVVVSPAIPPNSEFVLAARAAKVPVTTEICLFAERLPTRMTVGVTGTKGKSTTTALLGRMLQAATPAGRHKAWRAEVLRREKSGENRREPSPLQRGFVADVGEDKKHPAPAIVGPLDAPRQIFVGGNIGTSLLDRLPEITPADIVVLELSSFMLHHLGLIRWSPHVAVVTMVGTDHIEWHGGPDAYLADKQNLVRFQTEKDFAVVSSDSPLSRAFGKLTKGRVIEYGKRANLPAAFAPLLPGKHNRLNERGAYAAAKLFCVYVDEAEAQVKDFRGLPHRLELVHESDGVRWVNDSIATIPEAAVAANAAFDAGRVIQIVGGYDKHLDMAEMCRALGQRCKAVLTIGAIGPRLAEMIRATSPKAQVVECETLDRAVEHGRSIAVDGDVVLLSTACASYDQFKNFEDRGEQFTQLARPDSPRRHGDTEKGI